MNGDDEVNDAETTEDPSANDAVEVVEQSVAEDAAERSQRQFRKKRRQRNKRVAMQPSLSRSEKMKMTAPRWIGIS